MVLDVLPPYGLNYTQVFYAMRVCRLCGTTENLQVHHIDGQTGRWGVSNNNPSNLLVLCRECHTAEHKKPLHVVRRYNVGKRKGQTWGVGGMKASFRRNYSEV